MHRVRKWLSALHKRKTVRWRDGESQRGMCSLEIDCPRSPNEDFREVKVFQAKGTGDAKVLRQKQTQHVQGRETAQCGWSAKPERVHWFMRLVRAERN